MKNGKILALLYSILILFGCKGKDDDYGCTFGVPTPSRYKDYLPYKNGDRLIFKNGIGAFDTITVKDIHFDTTFGSPRHCDSYEEVECQFTTNWSFSALGETIHEVDWKEHSMPSWLWIRFDESFQADNMAKNGSAKIETFDSIQFNGKTYEGVLLTSCNVGNDCSPIDSLGFVKDKGLMFYYLNGDIFEKQ